MASSSQKESFIKHSGRHKRAIGPEDRLNEKVSKQNSAYEEKFYGEALNPKP